MRAPLLVGRDAELAALGDAVLATANGRGSLWFVSGEPGIGKSRLVEELSDRAAQSGLLVVWGRSWEAGGAPAYWPWIQVLRSLLRLQTKEMLRGTIAHRLSHLTQLMPELRERLGTAEAPPPLGAERQRFEILDAISAVLCDLQNEHGLLVILEDLHAADASSLNVFEVLGPELRSSKICVVGTLRDADARLSECRDALQAALQQGRTLPLVRLDRAQVRHFLLSFSHSEPNPSAIDVIFEATEGNPLFLQEVTRLIASQSAWDHVATAGLAIPGNIKYTLRRRVDTLPEAVRMGLEVASVLGRDFSGTMLSALWGRSMVETTPILGHALEAGLVIESAPGEYRFSHVLLREVLHQGLPDPKRAELHLEAAELLRRRKAGAVLWSEVAHHYLEAGPPGREGAVQACERAADAANRQSAFFDAGQWYSRALTALGEDATADLARRGRLLIRLASAELHSGAIATGKTTCERAAQLARELKDDELLARAALTYGSVFVFATVDLGLVRLLREALEQLEERDSALRATLTARLAAAEQPAPDPEQPIQMARDALAMARRLQDAQVWLETARYAVSAMMDLAEPSERLELNREYIEVALRLGQPLEALRGQMRLCFDHFELGDLASAELVVEAIESQAEQLGHPFYTWRAHAFRAMCALFEGQFDLAEKHRQLARELGERARDPNVVRVDVMQRYMLLKTKGSYKELLGLRQELIQAFHGLELNDLILRVYSSETSLLAGRLEQAAASIRPADIELALNLADVSTMRPLIGLAEVLGVPDLLPRLEARLGKRESRFTSGGMTLMTWGEPVALLMARIAKGMQRPAQATARFREAIEAAEHAGGWPFAAWARLELAEHLLAQGATRADAEVTELLRTARETAEQLGMTGLRERIDQLPGFSNSVAPKTLPARSEPGNAPLCLQRDGELWAVHVSGRTIHLRDSKGMQWLAELLQRPGEAVHVLDLVSPGVARDPSDAGELLDEAALSAYRQRVRDLQQELDEARGFNDLGRVSRLEGELEFLQQELSRAVGLGSRERRAGNQAERARINVQRRLRDAIARIRSQSEPLGQHLERAISTGVYCTYRP